MITLNTQQITVSKEKLLSSLEENRKKHISEYEQAMQDYHFALQVELQKALATVSAITPEAIEQIRNIKIDFDVPVSHVSAYDDIINMIKYSSNTEFILDTAAFNAYVNNKWPWQHAFLANSMKYSAAAGRR